jgi:cytochrome c biogenesis factor
LIPELGHAALWLAAAFALGGALLPRLAGRAELAHAFAAPAVTAYAVFALTALAALGWAFAAHDFSVALVNDHGHTSRSPLATIAATWSTPPGALLFWLASLGIAGTVLAAAAADTPERTRTLTMLLSVAAAGSLLLLLFTPFERAAFAAVEGRGLPLPLRGFDAARLLFAAGVLVVPAALLLVHRGTPHGAAATRPWLWAASALLALATAYAAFGATAVRAGDITWLRDAAPAALLWLAVTLLAWRSDRAQPVRPGRIIVAAGAAVAFTGAIASHALGADRQLPATPGTGLSLGGRSLRIGEVRAAAGEGYTALELALAGDATLRPQTRTSFAPGGVGAPPALDRSARGDLHASFDGRSLTLAWRPFAWTIWAGAALAALGGFTSVLAQRRD